MQRIYACPSSPEEYDQTDGYRQVTPESVCPRCRRSAALHRHGRYRRWVLTRLAQWLSLWIARFFSPACRHTISYLPDFALTYRPVQPGTFAVFLDGEHTGRDVSTLWDNLHRYQRRFHAFGAELIRTVGAGLGRPPPAPPDSERMNTLSAPSDESPRQRRALARFPAVQMVRQARQRGLALFRALQEAAQQPWEGRFYSPETTEAWVYRFDHGQFAALYDQPRRDQGHLRALDPAATEALLNLRRLHPTPTLTALAQELLRQGVLQAGAFSYSTLQRRLAQAGLDRRSLRAGAALLGGPTKAFELPLPNLLWMADAIYGPTLKLPEGKSQRTVVFAILDDHSRLCFHGQF